MLDAMLLALVVAFGALAAMTLAVPLLRRTNAPAAAQQSASEPEADIAVGVVRRIAEDDSAHTIGERAVTVDVETGTGPFTGRLRYRCGDPVASRLRPGIPVLVAFDPAAREHLSLPDDMTAVRAAFDQMLIGKGLLTSGQLDLIRHGTRSRGIITAMHPTGQTHEDYREVELDLIINRSDGGQFPAHETTLVPASALAEVCPGSVVDVYYRPGDESTVTVCVPG